MEEGGTATGTISRDRPVAKMAGYFGCRYTRIVDGDNASTTGADMSTSDVPPGFHSEGDR